MLSDVSRLLRQLVAIPSVNPGFDKAPRAFCGESRIADFLVDWAARLGIRGERIEAAPGRDCVLFSIGPESSSVITVSSHLDTVWTAAMGNPFELREDGGYLYGLGALDDKGPLAAALTAMARMKDRHLKCRFQVMGTCDEEYGLLGIRRMIPERCRPSALIVAEATGMRIIRAHKGSCRFTFRTRGKAVHSSLVPQGENAICKAAKIITALEEYGKGMLAEKGHPLLGTNTLSVGVITGGTQPSFVPDECTFIVNFRTLPGDTEERITARFRDAADAAGADYEIVDRSFDASGLDTPENLPLIKSIQELQKAFGYDPTPGGLPCATESFRAAQFGIPAIVWGPGAMETAHTAGERIEVEQLENYTEMLCQCMETAGPF